MLPSEQSQISNAPRKTLVVRRKRSREQLVDASLIKKCHVAAEVLRYLTNYGCLGAFKRPFASKRDASYNERLHSEIVHCRFTIVSRDGKAISAECCVWGNFPRDHEKMKNGNERWDYYRKVSFIRPLIYRRQFTVTIWQSIVRHQAIVCWDEIQLFKSNPLATACLKTQRSMKVFSTVHFGQCRLYVEWQLRRLLATFAERRHTSGRQNFRN